MLTVTNNSKSQWLKTINVHILFILHNIRNQSGIQVTEQPASLMFPSMPEGKRVLDHEQSNPHLWNNIYNFCSQFIGQEKSHDPIKPQVGQHYCDLMGIIAITPDTFGKSNFSFRSLSDICFPITLETHYSVECHVHFVKDFSSKINKCFTFLYFLLFYIGSILLTGPMKVSSLPLEDS